MRKTAHHPNEGIATRAYVVQSRGELTAVFIMAIFILTLAVITAQVASSFVDQAANRRGWEPQRELGTNGSTPALPRFDGHEDRRTHLQARRAAAQLGVSNRSSVTSTQDGS
jgi:peptidoglycan/LPS O-acetylase OafA/YrhL